MQPPEEEAKKEEEPAFQELKNPSRVVRQQETTIQYPEAGRYAPVLRSRFGGFVILQEINPSEEPEEFYDDEERDAEAPNPDLQTDLKLPEPFEFDPERQNASDSEDE